jgi:hypothetical protein
MITVICHRLLSIPGRKERESWTSKEGEVSADYPGQKIGWAFPLLRGVNPGITGLLD